MLDETLQSVNCLLVCNLPCHLKLINQQTNKTQQNKQLKCVCWILDKHY